VSAINAALPMSPPGFNLMVSLCVESVKSLREFERSG
jgi:hypothetical protein